MSRTSIRPVARTLFCLGLLLSAGWLVHAQQPTAASPTEAAGFTGKTAMLDSTGYSVGRRIFAPHSHNATWHMHTAGQLAFAESGRGRLQIKGQAIRLLAPGTAATSRRTRFTGMDRRRTTVSRWCSSRWAPRRHRRANRSPRTSTSGRSRGGRAGVECRAWIDGRSCRYLLACAWVSQGRRSLGEARLTVTASEGGW